jgi:hypothetical protein
MLNVVVTVLPPPDSVNSCQVILNRAILFVVRLVLMGEPIDAPAKAPPPPHGREHLERVDVVGNLVTGELGVNRAVGVDDADDLAEEEASELAHVRA